jgi:hypothetical protein
MDVKEIGCDDVDWIHLAQDRDHCEFGNEPSGCIICGEFLERLNSWCLLREDSAPWSSLGPGFATLPGD